MLRPLDGTRHGPRWIGPYRLLAELGSGGMGTVYLGRRDGAPGNPLAAVKTVRADLAAGGEFGTRFRREADAAGRVRSPWTAALVDADPEAVPPWLATEYVTGPSLHEAVAHHGPLPPATVRALGADLARALRAVHGVRVLHRDLKPANVLLAADGPKVIDFGIAHAFDATVLTATGVLVGTPGFMSPEHITGHADLTTASDVFCLGAVLCFAATGRGPFDDPEPAAVLHRIARGRADLTGVPEELRNVVEACLRLGPNRRPTTDELIRLLDDAPAPRPGPRPRARERVFDWPDATAALIAEHDEAVRRYTSVPVLPPPPAVSPPAVSPPAVSPPPVRLPPPVPVGDRPGRGLWGWRLALAGVAAAVAGLLTALLPPLLSGEDGTGGDSDRSASASPSADPTQAPPVITGETVEFGAEALSPRTRPSGWRPWTAELSGAPDSCVLARGLLLCTTATATDPGTGTAERSSHRLEALDAATGEPRWHHDYETSAHQGFVPAVEGDRVYVRDAEGDGVAVLRLSDGEPIDQWPSPSGYEPTKALAEDGTVYIGYLGPSGVGSASNTLFRAHRAEDGEKLWEFIAPGAFPRDMTLVGDRLLTPGQFGGHSADVDEGKAERGESGCVEVVPYGEDALCAGDVLDAVTLTVKGSLPVDHALAAGDRGVVVGLDHTGANRVVLAGGDLATGDRLWSVRYSEGAEKPTVLLAGDRFLTVDANGIASRALRNGEVVGGPQRYQGWPDVDGAPLALLGGGAVFLAFPDGTVLSGHAP